MKKLFVLLLTTWAKGPSAFGGSYLSIIIMSLFLGLFFISPVSADGGEVVCTPVYGMANTCAEHAVVDTGLDTGSLLNASALSYILGLAAFIKAKKG